MKSEIQRTESPEPKQTTVLLGQKLIEVEQCLSELQRYQRADMGRFVSHEYGKLLESIETEKNIYALTKEGLQRDLLGLHQERDKLNDLREGCLTRQNDLTREVAEVTKEIRKFQVKLDTLGNDLRGAKQEEEAIRIESSQVARNAAVIEVTLQKLDDEHEAYDRYEDPDVIAREAEHRTRVRVDQNIVRLRGYNFFGWVQLISIAME